MVEQLEEWKDIVDYEGLYQVSSLGNIKSKNKLRKQVKYGLYYTIQLRKKGKIKLHYVHRIVARTFIPNPLNKREVNHINGNKLDNRVINLEWATRAENEKHAVLTNLITKENIEKAVNAMKRKNQRAILQLKNGILVKRYESVRQASRENGWNCGAISECANGMYRTMYGYEWRYEK